MIASNRGHRHGHTDTEREREKERRLAGRKKSTHIHNEDYNANEKRNE